MHPGYTLLINILEPPKSPVKSLQVLTKNFQECDKEEAIILALSSRFYFII